MMSCCSFTYKFITVKVITVKNQYLTRIAYGKPGLMNGGVATTFRVNGVSANFTCDITACSEIPPEYDKG